MKDTKNKKRFSMPSAFTVLFFLIAAMALLTWLIPAGKYSLDGNGNIIAGTYRQVAAHHQGLWDIFMAPIIGMIGNKETSGAIQIALFILVIGGFLGVVGKTGALDDGIRTVVDHYRGKEKRLIIILIIIFSLGGSTYGMGEETMAFFPLLIPIMIGVGYDSIVAVAVILLSTRVGDLASTVNPFATGVASSMIGISPGYGLFSRVILLVIITGIEIWYVIRYAEKVKKDPTKSLVFHQRKEDIKRFSVNDRTTGSASLEKKQKIVLLVFFLTFFIMIVGLIPWENINSNWTFFATFNTWLTSNGLLGTLLGKDIPPLGSWYFNEITLLFIFMSVVVMFVSKMKEADFISSFMAGMSDLLSVAIIVAVARGIQVIMNDGMITGTILHAGETLLSGMPKPVFAVLAFVFFSLLTFLIPSSSGLAAATMGIMGSLAVFSNVEGSVVVSAYQAATGLITAITPTSAILMGSLAIAHIELNIWYKWVWKLIIILFIITCLFLIIVSTL